METKPSFGVSPPSFYSRTEKNATFVIGIRGESRAQRCSDRIGLPTACEKGVIRPLKRATDK